MRYANQIPRRGINLIPSGILEPPQKKIKLTQDVLRNQSLATGSYDIPVEDNQPIGSLNFDYDSDGAASVLPSIKTEDVSLSVLL